MPTLALRPLRVLAILLLSLVASAAAFADMPDLELNPSTGNLESVDTDAAKGERVRHVIDPGQGGLRVSTLVSTDGGDAPRIAITSSGNTWVVWWQDSDVDQVLWTVRDLGTGTWSQQKVLSDTDVDSRAPEIVHAFSKAWIVYEASDSGITSVTIASITDSPEPIDAGTAVATTDYGGDVDVRIHAESGNLWVTWVDSSTEVGWSEWDATNEEWTAPDYESYEGEAPEDARDVIRTTVLGSS